MTAHPEEREPAYANALRQGVLAARVGDAQAMLESCHLCPRACAVNRLRGETGICGLGARAVLASAHPHHGEEAPLVGRHGSGTIFISSCNLRCSFCQNYDISHQVVGHAVDGPAFASVMLHLQDMGCHNINIVTPTHVVPQLLQALVEAAGHGLHVPLVYNSGGYDALDTLKLLDGIVDIYMPDFKFWDSETAAAACAGAQDYPAVARQALREMHRQVGDLVLNEAGIAVRGLLVRHLVMPDSLAESRQILRFLAEEISPQTYVNVMAQYRPCGESGRIPRFGRQLRLSEFREAVQAARSVGLRRLDGNPLFIADTHVDD